MLGIKFVKNLYRNAVCGLFGFYVKYNSVRYNRKFKSKLNFMQLIKSN